MSIDIFESLRHRINMLEVATDEIEYDLSLIRYFDIEMLLEELKNKIKTIRYRIIEIEYKIDFAEAAQEYLDEDLKKEIETIEEEIKALEKCIEDIKDNYKW